MQSAYVLRELLNNNIPVVYEAHLQPGFLVADYKKVEQDSELGGFDLGSAFDIGVPHTFSCHLKPFTLRHTLLNLIETGFSEEVVFLTKQKWQAAFFDLPGIRVTAKTILIMKIHAERFFKPPFTAAPAPMSAVSAAVKAPAEAAPASTSISASIPPSIPAAPALACECCRPDRAEQSVSSLRDTFFEKRGVQWAIGQRQKMATQCGTFVELMDDPSLGALNRQMIWDYEAKLRKMPADRYDAKRRHGTNDANELLMLAEMHREKRLSDKTVERYMEALSSMFGWAVNNMLLTHNPAKRAIEKQKKSARDQDDRARFDENDLGQIFSAPWFLAGTGERNKQGRFHQFRPHFYWLPLLALYTGARLNELSQLYLSDLNTTDSGVHYVDFNLEGANKTDIDGLDKSLKTVSSRRIVAMHPHLVELGLPNYVKALSTAGFSRLFPELKHDSIKGYGKPAGSWFNERFLGKQLGMPRDGLRTFHSFRHTFITALSELDIPSDIQSQIAGHIRGTTITAVRYRKDAEAERLLKYIEQLTFQLPKIAPFKITDGIDSIKHALMRKKSTTRLQP
ncbi:site-specific integrase [Pseudomonas alliivorans]|nr:site-specific integrase [Pseudomonas alliivorans]